MNTVLWVCQGVLAAVFLWSGVAKSTWTKERMLATGQTGVQHLSLPTIRFIGVSEVLGTTGLLLPWLTGTARLLTPVAALCLGLVMVLAARVHYRRGEYKQSLFNLSLLLVCSFVTWGRWPQA